MECLTSVKKAEVRSVRGEIKQSNSGSEYKVVVVSLAGGGQIRAFEWEQEAFINTQRLLPNDIISFNCKSMNETTFETGNKFKFFQEVIDLKVEAKAKPVEPINDLVDRSPIEFKFIGKKVAVTEEAVETVSSDMPV